VAAAAVRNGGFAGRNRGRAGEHGDKRESGGNPCGHRASWMSVFPRRLNVTAARSRFKGAGPEDNDA
jgi:hypothetical protein